MSDFARYAGDLRAFADDLPDLASKVVRKSAFDTEADAKSLAPVDTGNLKNSIITRAEHPLRAGVVATASYAAYVEFPTSHTAPQPFMRPAQDNNTPAFYDAIQALADRL